MTRSAETPASLHGPAGDTPRHGGSRPADSLPEGAIPGEILPAPGEVVLNEGRPVRRLMVTNGGDRPVQVGSHYHFAEVNPALVFERAEAWGWRLDIPSGGAVRFEPGQEREVVLVPYAGAGRIIGFHGGDSTGRAEDPS